MNYAMTTLRNEYDFIAIQINNGMPMGPKQMDAFLISGKEIVNTMLTGKNPGWLKTKMLKLNVSIHMDRAIAFEATATGWEAYE